MRALVDDPDRAVLADGLVLPGVGAFGPCARALRRSGLDAAADFAIREGVPFLGICIGFQMLFEGSDEDPADPGLGVLPGVVRRLPEGVKHPQMQWNILDRVDGTESALLSGLPDPAWVYFVHSYAPELTADTSSTCEYGAAVTATAERGRVAGHPVPPREVRADRTLGPLQLRAARSTPSGPDGPLPGDRHPRRHRRSGSPRATSTANVATGIRSSSPRPSSRPARPGCTWWTSTRRVRAGRSTATW